MGKEPEAGLLRPFIEAAQEIGDRRGQITISCGFLAAFQRVLAGSVNVLVPLVRTMINSNKHIGIFTERAWNMDENHFNNVGWS